MQPMFALFFPMGGNLPVDPGFGQPGWPSHPIAPGGPPPGIWPSPGVPTHPIYYPPGPSQGPGFPTHPIAPGGPPPGVWPGPGYPSHPIAPGGGPSQGPGFPTQPIYLPSLPPPPDGAHVEHPIAGGWSLQFIPGLGWVVVPPPQGAGPGGSVDNTLPPPAQPK
jgi:hypothetical protein